MIFQEEWRDIPGYEGYYQVSSLGSIRRVKSITSGKAGKVVKPITLRNGYRLIQLSKDGVAKRYLVHRLVALTFIGCPPAPNFQVNHINSVRDDNRLANLEWLSPSDNQKHSFKNGNKRGQSGETNPQSKLTEEKVREIRTLLESGQTQREISLKFGVSASTIGFIGSRKLWKGVT